MTENYGKDDLSLCQHSALQQSDKLKTGINNVFILSTNTQLKFCNFWRFQEQRGFWLQIWVSLQTFSAFACQQSRARSKTCLCLDPVPKSNMYYIYFIYISSDSAFAQLTLSKEPGNLMFDSQKSFSVFLFLVFKNGSDLVSKKEVSTRVEGLIYWMTGVVLGVEVSTRVVGRLGL